MIVELLEGVNQLNAEDDNIINESRLCWAVAVSNVLKGVGASENGGGGG